MIVLTVDTSGKHGSVALARAEASTDTNDVNLIESAPLAGGTFSAQLVPQIAALLAKHGLNKTDIDAFVAVSGPGSFTGLRVGLAAIKALAEILKKPIVPVSLLEVVAAGGATPGKITAALDAGRGEVYSGEYSVAAGSAELLREQLLAKREFFSEARGSVVSTPDKILAGLARDHGLSVLEVDPPDAQAIARVGWRKFRANETVSPEQLEANYIRRTGAEIFAKANS
jgi:tRNA threonylcarbamoyladenosine biosynthesis protein TsaB